MKEIKRFIVIDDDKINNKIGAAVIEKLYPDALITTFTDPLAGFEHVSNEYAKPNAEPATLFLDINMPVMDAWGFLEVFDKLGDSLRNLITIFMLSSSIDKNDMERAMGNRNVTYYLIKPLTKESIKLLANLQMRKKQQNPSENTQNIEERNTVTIQRNEEEKKKIEAEKQAQLRILRRKDELVHREIPELEKSINKLLFDLEANSRETGLLIDPITILHSGYDKRKGGKLQLGVHFFEVSENSSPRVWNENKATL